MEIVIGIVSLVIFLLLLSVVIRGAIDSSKTTRQLAVLIDEVRMLRNDIKNSKHIVDKRV